LRAQVSVLPATAKGKLRWLTEQVLHFQYGMSAFALVIAQALTNAAVVAEVRDHPRWAAFRRFHRW
jgi:hypothetical protein